jgi:hypothetical protein
VSLALPAPEETSLIRRLFTAAEIQRGRVPERLTRTLVWSTPFLISLLMLAADCASSRNPATVPAPPPGHGSISIRIVPNPIVAQHAGGNDYDFPFEVVVQESGGRPVTVRQVTADVFAIGGLHVGSENYDAARIARLGYATTVPANGTLRYHFKPRQSVPDERLLNGVSAEVRVDAVDDTGTPVPARTTVTVKH